TPPRNSGRNLRSSSFGTGALGPACTLISREPFPSSSTSGPRSSRVRVKTSTWRPPSDRRSAAARMKTFIPPESPEPGWSRGDVCRLTTAILGAWPAGRPSAASSTVPGSLTMPMQESYGRGPRMKRRRSGGPASQPEPDLEPPDGPAAAEHGRRRQGRQPGALFFVQDAEQVERPDQRGGGGPVAPVVDPHGDPDPCVQDGRAVQALGPHLAHEAGDRGHQQRVRTAPPGDEVGGRPHGGDGPGGALAESAEPLGPREPREQRRHAAQRQAVDRGAAPVDPDHRSFDAGGRTHRAQDLALERVGGFEIA